MSTNKASGAVNGNLLNQWMQAGRLVLDSRVPFNLKLMLPIAAVVYWLWPLDLMPGLDADAPTKPFGGGEELSISPDGNEVAFAAQRMTRDAAWSTDVNVWTVPSKGGVPPKNVTADNLATDTQPSYSVRT